MHMELFSSVLGDYSAFKDTSGQRKRSLSCFFEQNELIKYVSLSRLKDKALLILEWIYYA